MDRVPCPAPPAPVVVPATSPAVEQRTRQSLPVHVFPIDKATALAVYCCRKALLWSQKDLAAAMKVPRTYVSKLENAKASPTLWGVERLAKAFGITPQFFVRIIDTISEYEYLYRTSPELQPGGSTQ